jgi:starvation-inducible outer membrane lipoprotein
MKGILIVLATGTMFLVGCTTIPAPSLQEQVQEKTDAERIIFLKETCLKEAAYRHTGKYRNNNNGHVSRMTEICNVMSDEMAKSK